MRLSLLVFFAALLACGAVTSASGDCLKLTQPLSPTGFVYRENDSYGFTKDTTTLSQDGKVTFDNSLTHTDKSFNRFSFRPADNGMTRDWRKYDGFRLKVRVSTDSPSSGYFGAYGVLHHHQLKQIEDQTDFFSTVKQNEKGNLFGVELGYYNDANPNAQLSSTSQLAPLPALSKDVSVWSRGVYRFYIHMENENSDATTTRALNVELLDVTKGGLEIQGSTSSPKRTIPQVTYSFDFRFDNITDPKLCNENLVNYDKYGYNADSTTYRPKLSQAAAVGDASIKVTGGGLPDAPDAAFLERLQSSTYTSGRDITTEFSDAGTNGLKVPKSLGGTIPQGVARATYNSATKEYTIHFSSNSAHHVKAAMPVKTEIVLWAHPPRRYQSPQCYVNKLGANQREGYGTTAPRDNVKELTLAPYMRNNRWISATEKITIQFSEIELYKCAGCADHKAAYKGKGCCARL